MEVSYSLTMEKVGLEVSSLLPIAEIISLIRVVFPAPISPSNKMILWWKLKMISWATLGSSSIELTVKDILAITVNIFFPKIQSFSFQAYFFDRYLIY